MPSTGSRVKVEEIKSLLDIVDVIGRDISLHKESAGIYAGATSSTSKSGASLKVDQDLQIFKNFATGQGGDVFDWIGVIHGIDARGAGFPEVLRVAAELAGVELEEMTEAERDAAKEKADIHNLFTEAADIYHKNLTPELYDVIKDKWGITPEIVNRFNIGYAAVNRNLKDLDKTTLKKSGLVYVNGGMAGGEVFAGRIVFPYWKNGKVVYLIGRETEETPKRKDGKDTSKYQKLLVHSEKFSYVSHSVQNSYFYGEDSLRGSDYCTITEGVADCIVMLQAGFPCISPVTVRFREEDHTKLISLTKGLKRVYICNDNEENKTGLEGALDTAEALESAGIEARLIILPKPEDYDKIDISDYMKDHSPDDFTGLIDSSVRLWAYKLNQRVIPASADSLERLRAFKSFILNDLHGMISEEWNVFVNNEVPEKFRLKLKDVKSTVEEIGKRRQEDNKSEISEPAEDPDEARDTEKSPDKYPQWAIDKANETLDNEEALNYILGVWQKRHVGDTNIGENCMCSVITSRILNSKRGLHIKPSGDSGKGKSDAIECFLELLPIWAYITGSMSAKALFYDGNLKPGTLIYSDDASFTDDVISTIKQSTSKFQKVTVHRTVVNGEAQNLPIPERVTFWFSAVEGMDDEQLANRFLHADVDSSSEQDEKVFDHQVDSEAWYESDSVEPDVLICRCIFDILFNQFYRVKIPYVKAIIWNNKENRRNFDKFKDVIRSITVYNYRHREVIDGFLISTPEDYEEALKIYKGTSVNNATNLTNTEIKYLRFIVGRPNKTTTLKELVNHFKVTETAVRKMLNGKKGDGGLLAKIKQLIVIDGSQTVKSGDVTASTREKRYQYIGEFTGLDMYESISSLDKDEVGRVTSKFMAQMHENMLRVTQGNPEGNLSKVTLENDISIDNNNNNNTRVTQDIEERGGCNSVRVSVVESNSPDELTHVKTEVTLSSEKQGYPHDKISQMIAETWVTSNRLPQVREGYPSPINDIEVIENKGYPSTDSGHDLNYEESLSVDGNIHLLPLLRQALLKLAKTEYHSTVLDLDEFTRDFNSRTPEFKKTLGSFVVENEARKLKILGW